MHRVLVVLLSFFFVAAAAEAGALACLSADPSMACNDGCCGEEIATPAGAPGCCQISPEPLRSFEPGAVAPQGERVSDLRATVSPRPDEDLLRHTPGRRSPDLAARAVPIYLEQLSLLL